MSDQQTTQLRNTLGGLDRIRSRMEEELHKLCDSPDTFCIAQALADGMLSSLTYLCNFESAVGNNGHTTPIQEVIARLATDMDKEFLKLTGRKYVNEAYRQLTWNTNAPRRLLQSILEGARDREGKRL
jgi:hypothetical protein